MRAKHLPRASGTKQNAKERNSFLTVPSGKYEGQQFFFSLCFERFTILCCKTSFNFLLRTSIHVMSLCPEHRLRLRVINQNVYKIRVQSPED